MGYRVPLPPCASWADVLEELRKRRRDSIIFGVLMLAICAIGGTAAIWITFAS